ncbi:MAG: ADP-forming succinate--CoA ligase subunit beta [Elusimicrobia bacterium]|nr:ADP-forming succinate--CoA ligase subunit beta [Elusimicrobiota bacterium]
MKLLEYESKALLELYHIPLSKSGGVISSAGQLNSALKRAGCGPWVIKAQVLAGGRGKAGGVKIAKTMVEAKQVVKAMLGMELKTHQTGGRTLVVREVLVEHAAPIDREIYLAVTMDRGKGLPVLVGCGEGGVEIEELARTKPEKILREEVDPSEGLNPFQARRLCFSMGIPADQLSIFVRTAQSLARLFLEKDASVVEINPLVLSRGKLLALDAKIVLDDNALFRHPDFAKRSDHESSPLEREAKRVGISYIGLEGNIGCLVNGAGLAMGTMDSIKLAGGDPANFLDVGGGASAAQVESAFNILLRDKKVKAVLVNIFGGIMKCDTIAEGIIKAISSLKSETQKAKRKAGFSPIVVRLEGTHVQEGRDLLTRSGLPIIQAHSLSEAAEKAVQAAKQEG